MIWQLDLAILTLVVICAIGAISVKDLLGAAILFGAYSFMMCLLWAIMGAVDVAFTEASVGAGVSTVFFVAAVFRTTRRTQGLKIIGLIIVVLLGGLLLYRDHATFPPGAIRPRLPAPMSRPAIIEKAMEETAVPNIVTAVLADYRGFDTMFETTVIFCAGVACFFLLRVFKKTGRDRYYRHIPTGVTIRIKDGERFRRTRRIRTDRHPWTPYDLIIKTVCRLVIPFIQLFALYVIAHGHHSPGADFRAASSSGASIILLAISYDLRTAIDRIGEKADRSALCRRRVHLCRARAPSASCWAPIFWTTALLPVLLRVDPVMARSHGILIVEIGVGIAVMAVMIWHLQQLWPRDGKYDEGL